VPLAFLKQVFALYRKKYFDVNVRHFHEKLQGEHQIHLSYTRDEKGKHVTTQGHTLSIS
jgi:hypothetical protein